MDKKENSLNNRCSAFSNIYIRMWLFLAAITFSLMAMKSSNVIDLSWLWIISPLWIPSMFLSITWFIFMAVMFCKALHKAKQIKESEKIINKKCK